MSSSELQKEYGLKEIGLMQAYSSGIQPVVLATASLSFLVALGKGSKTACRLFLGVNARTECSTRTA